MWELSPFSIAADFTIIDFWNLQVFSIKVCRQKPRGGGLVVSREQQPQYGPGFETPCDHPN